LIHTATKTFRLVLIKPSHYNDDGYVIQFDACLYSAFTLANRKKTADELKKEEDKMRAKVKSVEAGEGCAFV